MSQRENTLNMTKNVLLKHDLSIEEIKCDQGMLANRLNWNNMTFVGAIPSLDIFILADKDIFESTNESHPLSLKKKELFMEEFKHISGDLLFIASDNMGEPIDIDIEILKRFLFLF